MESHIDSFVFTNRTQDVRAREIDKVCCMQMVMLAEFNAVVLFGVCFCFLCMYDVSEL